MDSRTQPIDVLLVEDDEEDYMIVRDMLDSVDGPRFRVSWANCLSAGLSALDQKTDAVLLDLSLPDSSGWQTFERVHDHAPDVPIILLTGLSDEELAVRAVQEGAQDYLAKGHLSANLLGHSVRYAIERRRTQAKLVAIAEELRQRNDQMADDLRMAREIQRALLPRKYPSFPPGAPAEDSAIRFAHRYSPTQTVGGDFFYLLQISPSTAGIFICDVMGHGVRAALVTAIVRGMLEELKPFARHPGRLLSEINRDLIAILRQRDDLIFTSALYLVIDVAEGTITCANAGHPHPLYLCSSTGDVHPLRCDEGPRGPALGIHPEWRYGDNGRRVDPGDAVVLFTDGLFEIRNAHGDEYGEERLTGIARANMGRTVEQVLDALMADVEAFSTSGQEDDVCLVGVEVTRTGVALPG